MQTANKYISLSFFFTLKKESWRELTKETMQEEWRKDLVCERYVRECRRKINIIGLKGRRKNW
jgi:hypothetical protein